MIMEKPKKIILLIERGIASLLVILILALMHPNIDYTDLKMVFSVISVYSIFIFLSLYFIFAKGRRFRFSKIIGWLIMILILFMNL